MNDLVMLRKLAEQQQYSELKDSAEAAWTNNQNPAILPLWAIACAQCGLQQKTETLYKESLKYKANFDNDALCDLAAVLIMMQRLDEAKEILTDILADDPVHSLTLARLGYSCLLSDDATNAHIYFTQSLAFTPERLPVHLSLITLNIAQNLYPKAQVQLEKAFLVLEQQYEYLSEQLYQHYWLQLNTTQLQLWAICAQYAPAEEWLNTLHLQQQAGECEENLFIHCLKHYSRSLAELDQHQQAMDILREYIKYYETNSALFLSLAELSQVQGHFMSAINLLHKALAHDDENIDIWIELSHACLHRLDKKARHAAEKATELSLQLENDDDEQTQQYIERQRAKAKHALAQVESQEQNFTIAESIYRELLAENNSFVPALLGLGQQQMQQGHIDEALELFEQVKALDPLKGYSALINARRFPDKIDILNKLEQAALSPSMEGTLRSGILFQLASAWQHRKEYNKAFHCAQLANQGSKKFLSYDAQKHRNKCARIRLCFSQSLYQHRPNYGIDSTLPIYVLGMPRSGTTLVEQILSGHSDIFGAGELDLIPQVAQGLNRWERHTGSGRIYPDCIDDLTPYVTKGFANKILKELQEYAPNAKHVVDKLPHNFENIGLIKFLFPNAKIISVRRDPRDIAMSNYFTDYQAKHGGMGFAYDLETIGEQLADHNLLMDHWHKTFPGEILELNYEDVVDDLEGSAKKMLHYIGVEWQKDVLKFNELDRTVKTASVWQVRQPIYKTSKAKWKRYEKHLSPLIKGTNASIRPDPIDNIITLPVPGFLTDGVALYKEGKLDEAETCFKKMLHHNPDHAACNYMVGLVYLSKNYLQDGIAFIEKALEISPWHKEWKDNLIKAYRLSGDMEKIDGLESKLRDSSSVKQNYDMNDEEYSGH